LDHLSQELSELAAKGRRRELIPRRLDGPWIVLTDGRRLINFGGNDYLGLATRSIAALPTVSGSGASPLVCGWTDAHQRLTETIASFEGTEAAVLFPSGYAACSGTVATLAQKGDLILSDQLNHASLIDGCRLSRAQTIVFRHRDCQHAEEILSRCRAEFSRAWILTDAVFSMDGHVAPLRDLCEIAERFDAHVIVDEAHATGVLGETGSGLCEAVAVKDRVAVRIGTLSKAVGSQGGFVAANRVVIDYLINRARSLIYSTALSPLAVAAAEQALDQISSHPRARIELHELARTTRRRLGMAVDPPEDSVPIIPVIVGEDTLATRVSQSLAEAGFYVPAIRPPTVPEGTARLRISLSALHQPSMVENLLRQFEVLQSDPGYA
jgi:8-amino-7-oxononanoate synthase